MWSYLIVIMVALCNSGICTDDLIVYDNIPGMKSSTKYNCHVRSAVSNPWKNAFVIMTTSKKHINDQSKNICNGYFEHLTNWTASWINIEVSKDVPFFIQITKTFDTMPIHSATIHPELAMASVKNINGSTVIIKMVGPGFITVDINGQMDETDTGPSYEGPAIHTFSIFANPMLSTFERPDPHGSDVELVKPGDPIPNHFNASTLYFAPGIHRIPSSQGFIYTMQSQKHYYLPGDAWLNGALNNSRFGDNGIKIFGYGTISGIEIPRGPIEHPLRCKPNNSPQCLTLSGVFNSTVYGITCADHPNHHFILGGSNKPDAPNLLSHIKVMGWRANGDGVHVFSYWKVKNCFLRAQDDSLYIGSAAKEISISQITTWNDANGASFIFTAGGGGKNSVVDDCDVIYARAEWAFWNGGRIFSQRGVRDGAVIQNITVKNIRITDNLPTMAVFYLSETPDSDNVKSGTFRDITFQNIIARNASTVHYDRKHHLLPHGLLNIITGNSTNINISNIAFNNVSIAGLNISLLINDKTWFDRGPFIFNMTVDGKVV